MRRYILALDQGTTSSRALLFDHDGRVIGVGQQEFTQYFPQPGWVEHDAEEIWSSQCAAIAACLQHSGARLRDIEAIGIANQRETTVLWDRCSGRPVGRAIVWQDRRTAGVCDTLRAQGLEGEITRRTGLVLDPYFCATKLAWMLDNVPDARTCAARGELAFGTVDSWLAFKLTGTQHVTDATNASRTLLFNLHSGDWDDQLLEWLRVPRECLPRIVASSRCELEARIDDARIPLAGIAGDQQAALFGQACFAPGLAKNTYGTGCFLLMNTGTAPQASRHRLLTTLAWRRATADGAAPRATHALEGSVFMGGATVQWLRDGLGIIERAADVEALAGSAPDNGGVVLVPAFAGLGSPHWDAHARGTILGLTRGSTRAHIARAALEAIALQSAELVDAMQLDAGEPLRELRVDGGASANDLLMQIQADVLGVPVARPRLTETTALGAAWLAGLGVGFWTSEDELAAQWQLDRRFEPRMPRERVGALRADWTRAVQRAKSWAQEPS